MEMLPITTNEAQFLTLYNYTLLEKYAIKHVAGGVVTLEVASTVYGTIQDEWSRSHQNVLQIDFSEVVSTDSLILLNYWEEAAPTAPDGRKLLRWNQVVFLRDDLRTAIGFCEAQVIHPMLTLRPPLIIESREAWIRSLEYTL
jgi:hypothetical protein